MIHKNEGSVFLIVIGVLAVILFAAGAFMASTIEESRQTAMSVRGLQTVSLAEAALERAMRILSDDINVVRPDLASADDPAILLRLPAQKMASSVLGISGSLGGDEQLALPEKTLKEIILTKADLQAGADNNDLDKMVYYMTTDDRTDKGIKDYDVTVKVVVEKAYRLAPGNDYSDFKVPGVDIPWNLRPDVKSFLDGNGYSALEIGFPNDLTWLNFSVPIEIMGFKLIDINVVNIVDNLMPSMNILGQERSFKELTSFDFMADALLNHIISRDGKKIYPIEVPLDKVDMPSNVSAMWPSGTNINTGVDEQYIEKYGQIKLSCEAKITYNDGYTSRRAVSAIKDFKVADCEPIAPMYSFFIANLKNDYIQFNNYGGTFLVNNFDYTGSLSKVKEVFTGTSSLSDEDIAKREFPGLIRVNYIDNTDDGSRPLICNAGLMGDWNAPKVAGDDSGFIKNILQGLEATLIVAPATSMAVVGAKYNINAELTKRTTSEEAPVPVSLKGPSTNDGTVAPVFGKDAPIGQYGVSNASVMKEPEIKGPKEYLKKFASASNLNLIPDVGKMSTNVIALAATLALKPLVAAVPLNQDICSVPDCFQKWEMPHMGTSNWLYPIPTTGTGANKTHLFGAAGLHPTLTREIEGNVMKGYRQWRMCIVGMKPTDRLPLLPIPPYLLPPPPYVVPIWYAQEVLTKYDYNLVPLKANDASGNPDKKTYSYDPAQIQNMPPNLYTPEQYVKKASYYYESGQAFIDDLPNRMTTVNGKNVFVLNGITYISGSLGSPEPGQEFSANSDFYVVGKGMIVCSGNIYIANSIRALDRNEDEKTVFTLMSRNGALISLQGNKQIELEGSLYTEKGIYCHANSSIRIVGNWVTNQFNKASMGGTVVVDYVSSRVRSSLGSLHPERGKYDPNRYHISFSPSWASWRVE